MTDLLGESPTEYYTVEQARLYNLSGAFKRIQKRMTLDALSISGFKKGSRVLDLGCGTGFSTMVLKEEGYEVIGCDVNENMLKHAREKGLKVVKCDMKRLPFKTEEFNHLISISSIQWAKPLDYPIIISEINRVIKTSSVVQFYPKNRMEFDYFLEQARKKFKVETHIIGAGRKQKTYVMLKKRRRVR
jgi:ubiquinone/menaquinone biosynthesis C-methylase UbiE